MIWSQHVHFHIPVLLLSYRTTELPMVLVRNWLERQSREKLSSNSLLLYIRMLVLIINKTLFVEALMMLICLLAFGKLSIPDINNWKRILQQPQDIAVITEW